MIQTYQPDHYAVTRAAAQDYEGFYGEEILYREMMGYPPASHMLAVQVFSGEEKRGRALAEQLAALVRESFGLGRGAAGPASERQAAGTFPMGASKASADPAEIQVIGPAPASISRINDIFRFVFYVKCSKYGKLIRIKDLLEEKIQQVQPAGETVQFDFNPINII